MYVFMFCICMYVLIKHYCFTSYPSLACEYDAVLLVWAPKMFPLLWYDTRRVKLHLRRYGGGWCPI